MFSAEVTVAYSRGWMDVLQMSTYHYDIDEDRSLLHKAHVTMCAFGLVHNKTVVQVHEEAQTEALWTAPPLHT